MKPAEIETLIRTHFNVRLEPAMCAYVCRKLKQGQALPDTLTVFGGDARTGVPVRFVMPALLANEENKPV